MATAELAEQYIALAQTNLISTYNSLKELLKYEATDLFFCDFGRNRFETNLMLADRDYETVEPAALNTVFRQGTEALLKALVTLKGISATSLKLPTMVNLTLLHYSSTELAYFIKKYIPYGVQRTIDTQDFYAVYEALEDVKLIRKIARQLYIENADNYVLE